MTACFLLDDGETRITVTDGAPRPSHTVEGPHGEDRVVAYGILQRQTFVYVTGSRFHWDDRRGWWSGNAVSVGVEATRVPCN